jgi:hypothetical protein
MIFFFRVTVFSGCRQHGVADKIATAAQALAGFGNHVSRKLKALADFEINQQTQPVS